MDFELKENVALLRFDDGKANAVTHEFINEMLTGLERAEKEADAVVIIGRPERFSGGFDLSIIRQGQEAVGNLLMGGTKMFLRMYSHPQPLVAACNGHAIAAGAFMLLACDTRIGTRGDFKIGLNETAIGSSFPVFGHELASSRLSKRHLTAALLQSQMYNPDSAVDAGFLDQVVDPTELESTALRIASQLAKLPGKTYARNKLDSRAESIERIKASLSDPAA